ncbi:MAG: hypothetical protein K2W99_02420 [Chthoniobacterales bacterium]|nr:hypothetical protein [Chthoniobacterales bacterium]
MNSSITSNQPSREELPSLNSISQSPNTREETKKPTVTVNTPATLKISHLSSNDNPRDFATYLGPVTSAPIQASIVPSVEGKNEVKYSDEKIIICQDPFTEIPKNGFFRAGSNLLDQITEELVDHMDSEILKAEEHGDDTTKQQKVDQGRNTGMVLKNSSSPPTEKKSPTNAETAEFLKEEGYDFTLPAGSVFNQTLGNMCNLLYSQAALPRIHEQAKLNNTAPPFECLDARGAIAFPSPSSGVAPASFKAINSSEKKIADLQYELEKTRDKKGTPFIVVKFISNAQSQAVFLRKEQHLPSEAPSELIPLDTHIQQSCFSIIEVQLSPNLDFNKELPRSRKNSPYTVKCLDLRNSYRTEEKPQKQSPEQDFRSQATAATLAATKAASQAASQAVGLFKTATSLFSSKKPPNE